MIRRTLSAVEFNTYANHPSVRPYIGGDGALDFGPLIADPANICLLAEQGGWFLHPILQGVYEVHTCFLPEGRGKRHLGAAREAFRYLFTRTDCLEVVTKCPDDNGPARMAAASLGFRERFRREDAWKPGIGISYQVFSLDDWMARDADCIAAGERFHAQLETAKREADSQRPVHPDDAAHDRAVGAAALMIGAGQIDKGVATYNRWAAFAGYAQIGRLAANLIDVVDAIIEIETGAMRVLLVR